MEQLFEVFWEYWDEDEEVTVEASQQYKTLSGAVELFETLKKQPYVIHAVIIVVIDEYHNQEINIREDDGE